MEKPPTFALLLKERRALEAQQASRQKALQRALSNSGYEFVGGTGGGVVVVVVVVVVVCCVAGSACDLFSFS